MDIEKVIVETLANIIEKEPDYIRSLDKNELLKPHGVDSLKFIRFIVEIEKNLSIEVPDNDLDMDKFATLDKIYTMLSAYVNDVKMPDNTKKPIIKCIITDCDNCLWGGIAADDGYENLIINGAYIHLQQILAEAYTRGVLLALCSKNDEKTITDIFTSRSDMILKPANFVTRRVNWKEKHENIADVARELNIGLDSILYIDDSERELFWLSKKLPDVRAVLFDGKNTEEIERILSGVPSPATAESMERTQLYLQEKTREASKSAYDNIEDYYGSLKTVLTFKKADIPDTERLVELSQRTNQFNLNATRYSEEEIHNMIEDTNYEIIALTADDIFGTLGLCAFCVIKYEDRNAVIDGLMMSCRVFGRNFEDMMFTQILKTALTKNCRQLIGLYTPTDKNTRFAEFYLSHGFKKNDNILTFDLNDNCACNDQQIPSNYFSEIEWI